MEYTNSSNQSANLKEKYDDKDKMAHYADGGVVDNGIPEGYVADSPTPNTAPHPAVPYSTGQFPYRADQMPEGYNATGQGMAANAGSGYSGVQQANEIPETIAMMVAPEFYGAGKAAVTGFKALNDIGGINLSKQGLKAVPEELGTVANAIHQPIQDSLGVDASQIGAIKRPELLQQLSPELQGVYNNLLDKAKAGDSGAQGILAQVWASAKEKGWSFAHGGEIPHLADGGMPEGYVADTPVDQSPVSGIPQGYEPEESSPVGYLQAAGRSAAKGILGPLAPYIEQHVRRQEFGTPVAQTQAEQRGSQAQYPMTSLAGEVGGLGVSMATGVGEGAIAAKLGEAVAPAATSTIAKIGSRAVSDAIANAAITSSDEVSKLVMGDPNQSVESAAQDIGLSGLIGGTLGAGIGAVPPIWKATMGGKLGEALGFIQKKLGGIEGAGIGETATDKIINASGLDLPAEQRAVLNNDPGAQSAFSHLMQSDESASGKQVQEAYRATKVAAADDMIGALGKNPKSAIPEFSKYESGKTLGTTLAKEYESQVSPLAEQFEKLKAKTQNADLIPDKDVTAPTDYSNPYNPTPGVTTRVPGTISKAQDEIAQLAQREGWMSSPSSEQMKAANQAIKELSGLKTVKELSSYITQVGDNTASSLPFGQQTPLSRAGSLIKNILRDAESDVTIQRLGEKEGPETVAQYQQARQAYAQQAKLKEYLNDNLKVGGSTSGFAKGLRAMAQTDGEAVFNKLSGKGNADLLEFLSKNYPKTAQILKSIHVDSLLDSAASKAKEGQKISISALRSTIEKMSPELRNFVLSPETTSKIDALGQVLDKLEPKNYNFSNTARTLSKHLTDMGGSAMGVVAHLHGAGPIASVLSAVLGKYATHSIPDAMRLSMLKFMGSNAPLNSTAFKAMTQSMESMIKGENLLSKAAKNIFIAEREVLPKSFEPTHRDRTRLQAQLDEFQSNPNSLLNAKNDTSHYMPDHGASQVATITRAAQYLDQLKPAVKRPTPLDTPIKPTSSEKAAYDNALNIASQPLIVMNKIKAGTATPADVAALKAIYPNLYARYAQKLTTEMTEALSKGKVIPYRTKLGLSQFLGQPMDSTMTSSSILASQPQPVEPSTPPPGQAPGERPKHSMTSLNKMPSQYMTQEQARDSRARREKQ